MLHAQRDLFLTHMLGMPKFKILRTTKHNFTAIISLNVGY